MNRFTDKACLVPEAVLPLDVQKRVYERCKDQTDSVKPPPAFVEELSNLPPYVRINDVFSVTDD